MKAVNLEAGALLDYTAKMQLVESLRHNADDLRGVILSLDSDIEAAIKFELGEVVDSLCELRNSLDHCRIDLEIQCNQLEREVLDFEMIRHATR